MSSVMPYPVGRVASQDQKPSEAITTIFALIFAQPDSSNVAVERGIISPLFIDSDKSNAANISRLTSACAESVQSESLTDEFERLSAKWKQDTSFHSSLGEIFTHEAYQRIIGMGRDALPMILGDLQKKPAMWFYALEKIVGYDAASEAKNYADARSAWLEWGYRNNHI